MSIQKVAKLAGVSNSTVSRVINNRARVAPETVTAVREAMDKLGYTPSDRRPGPKPMPDRLASGSIGFYVVGGSEGAATPGFMDLLRGVSSGANGRKFSLTYDHVSDPDHLANRLRDQRLDGVILHGAAFDLPAGSPLRRVPCVWVMGNRQRPTWGDQVMPDVFEIGVVASDFLREQGHERLAFINLDEDHWSLQASGQSFVAATLRAGGGATAITRRRQPLHDYWQPYHADHVNEVVDRFLALDPRPTAIFVADSMQAALVQPNLVQRGIAVGEGGVQIITSNREEPYFVGLSPRPAAIDVRIEAIGRQGVEQLHWRKQNPHVPERVTRLIAPDPASIHA